MEQQIEQKFSVHFSYQVHFTDHLFDKENALFASTIETAKGSKVLFVVDEGVALAHPRLLQEINTYASTYQNYFTMCRAPLVLPGGEQIKNSRQFVDQVLDAVNTFSIDRHSFIVAIGGGALLDMVGFASAIAHRGIRHIRIPTTVLSQNDSGVGVKNGINAYGKKNYLGTFAPPYAVINDSRFLNTLDDRDWRSGISEAIKVALIKDEAFFLWIEEHADQLSGRSLKPMQQLIYRCAEMHLAHIAGADPFETGCSRPLDFGHWAAHKLEQLTDYGLRHGEAVAIGIALDATYSTLAGLLAEKDLHRITDLFKRLNLPVYVPELKSKLILEGLNEFREHLGGELTVMLLQSIGKGVEVHQLDDILIGQAIDHLKSLSAVPVGEEEILKQQ